VFFSKIDLKTVYHQIPIDEPSIEVTAFICEFGLFEYVSMPMGIKNAPAWFQRAIENTLADQINRGVVGVYLDDTVLFTKDLDTHVREAFKIVEVFQKTSFKVSIEKSKILTKSMPFLGNVVSHRCIKPDPDRAKCFLEKPKPKTLRDVQVWLGVDNYYRKAAVRDDRNKRYPRQLEKEKRGCGRQQDNSAVDRRGRKKLPRNTRNLMQAANTPFAGLQENHDFRNGCV
jgi:hypothetical protein